MAVCQLVRSVSRSESQMPSACRPPGDRPRNFPSLIAQAPHDRGQSAGRASSPQSGTGAMEAIPPARARDVLLPEAVERRGDKCAARPVKVGLLVHPARVLWRCEERAGVDSVRVLRSWNQYRLGRGGAGSGRTRVCASCAPVVAIDRRT